MTEAHEGKQTPPSRLTSAWAFSSASSRLRRSTFFVMFFSNHSDSIVLGRSAAQSGLESGVMAVFFRFSYKHLGQQYSL